MTRIPFLSADKSSSEHGFDRLAFTRAYLRSLSEAIPDPGFKRAKPVVRELMEACGFRDIQRFREQRKSWDALVKPIPRAYLNAIGATTEGLEHALNRDHEAFAAALSLPRTATAFIIKYHPAFYVTEALPHPMPEADAIAHVSDQAVGMGYEMALPFHPLKTVFCRKDGSVHHQVYHPQHIWTPQGLSFGPDGSNLGDVALKS